MVHGGLVHVLVLLFRAHFVQGLLLCVRFVLLVGVSCHLTFASCFSAMVLVSFLVFFLLILLLSRSVCQESSCPGSS